VDDTVKLAGYHRMDVKTGHLTIVDPVTKSRQTFSTGFSENLSPSGKDSAKNIEKTLAVMAALTNTTPSEVKELIDLWRMDRAADNNICMDELGVDKDRRLKCTAHIILCEKNSLDTVFMEVGEKVGSDKLNSTKASHVFSSGRGGKQSIWTLGEIAFEKLLSPKFCKDSISQFVSYKRFLTEDSRDETSDTSSLSKSILSQNFDGYD
jgi:hypothetical protein